MEGEAKQGQPHSYAHRAETSGQAGCANIGHRGSGSTGNQGPFDCHAAAGGPGQAAMEDLCHQSS